MQLQGGVLCCTIYFFAINFTLGVPATICQLVEGGYQGVSNQSLGVWGLKLYLDFCIHSIESL